MINHRQAASMDHCENGGEIEVLVYARRPVLILEESGMGFYVLQHSR